MLDQPHRFSTLCAPLLVLAIASIASASDGVIEINHTRALAGGITPGDTPGYPVTIDAPGSYRLTGNLAPTGNSIGVDIEVASVSLDLGGFEIRGENSCSGSPVTCTYISGAELVRGIAGAHHATIRNGKLHGARGTCIETLGDAVVVEDVTIRECGGDGIQHNGTGSVVRRVSVSLARLDGLDVDQGGLVERVTAQLNGGRGIEVDSPGGRIAGCTVYGNGGTGIWGSIGTVIEGNSSNANGDDGIAALGGSRVSGNAVGTNAGWGLDLASDAGYADNTMRANTMGTVNGGTNAGGNICNGSATCP